MNTELLYPKPRTESRPSSQLSRQQLYEIICDHRRRRAEAEQQVKLIKLAAARFGSVSLKDIEELLS